MSYKKILLSTAAVFVVLPILAFAQTGGVKGKKGFCNLIATASSKIGQRITGFEQKLESKRVEITNKINTRQNERDEKLAKKRARWDTNRSEHFAKLEEKAKTDEQKQALVVFHDAVEAAIAARRVAIDAAIQQFREGVNAAISSRKSAADTVVLDLKNAISSAVEKANNNCDNGVSPDTVRETLRSDLKNTREKFVDEKQDAEKIGTAMESLIAARKAAIQKAIDDFKAAVEKAKNDFKAVFQEDQSEE